MTTIVWNEEMDDILKRLKSLEYSGLLVKVLAKQLKMKQKSKRVHFQACYLVHEALV